MKTHLSKMVLDPNIIIMSTQFIVNFRQLVENIIFDSSAFCMYEHTKIFTKTPAFQFAF